jgi:16S rRNA (guanine(966)-N(2))-methyltransferase RsmD
MRIIGGTYRGRKIEWPDLGSVRPTKDRIRQAVFNVLGDTVENRRVLDLFAGSGAFGLEALSRGATGCIFVDDDVRCVKVIKKNMMFLGVNAADIIRGDVFKTVEELHRKKESFDIIFADPPYNAGLAKKTLITLGCYDILTRPALVIVEHHEDEGLSEGQGSLSILKQKTYNDIVVSFYLKK